MSTNFLILGLGESGFACAKFLLNQSIPFILADTRVAPPYLESIKQLDPSIKIYLSKLPDDILHSIQKIIISPGMDLKHPWIEQFKLQSIPIISEIELFASYATAPIIAISGSNGKSTVTTLVGELAAAEGVKVAIGGNLAPPAIDLLTLNPDLYVLELSSFQLESTFHLKPLVATILNISPDHMDRYGTLQEYIQAKMRIFKAAKHIVYNRDDSPLLQFMELSNTPHISFGVGAPESNTTYGLRKEHGALYLARGAELLLNVQELKLLGTHNYANCLAALALMEAAGFNFRSAANSLKSFVGLAHRCEWVRMHNQVLYVNDSKGTNVGAVIAALQGLSPVIPGKWILIAGGQSKNADFTDLIGPISQHCKAVILLGEDKQQLHELLKTASRCYVVDTLAEAVSLAAKQAKPGEGVLLSPACASLDMYANYAHRGNVFKQLVQEL